MEKFHVYCIAHFSDGRTIYQTRQSKRPEYAAAAFMRFIYRDAERPDRGSYAKSFEFSTDPISEIGRKVRGSWQTAEIKK